MCGCPLGEAAEACPHKGHRLKPRWQRRADQRRRGPRLIALNGHWSGGERWLFSRFLFGQEGSSGDAPTSLISGKSFPCYLTNVPTLCCQAIPPSPLHPSFSSIPSWSNLRADDLKVRCGKLRFPQQTRFLGQAPLMRTIAGIINHGRPKVSLGEGTGVISFSLLFLRYPCVIEISLQSGNRLISRVPVLFELCDDFRGLQIETAWKLWIVNFQCFLALWLLRALCIASFASSWHDWLEPCYRLRGHSGLKAIG